MASPSRKPRRQQPRGIIRAGEAYSLTAFSRATGLREHGLRQLRRRGLKAVQLGRQKWVIGASFIELLARLGSDAGSADR